MTTNKYGLARTIPSPIKREIRQKCGHGCVICALSIYTYEHIDPLFCDAKEHDPEKMALLCGSCHLLVTKGIYSKEKVTRALKHPKAFEKGVSKFEMDVDATGNFILSVGNTDFINLERIIEIDGQLILGINPPEALYCPPRLTAKFYDRNSKPIATIVDNEWQGSANAFDIESEGKKLKARSKLYGIDLELHVAPPTGVRIEKLNLSFNGRTITGSTEKGFKVITDRAETFIRTDKKMIQKAPYWINLTDILKLGSDEVITYVSNGVAQQLPGALIHEGVKTEYLELEENQPFDGRPMRITSTEPGGCLMFEVDLPAAKIKKEYLKQSPQNVIDLFNEIEEFSGKEIQFVEKEDLRGHGLASSVNEFNATIYFHDKEIRPPAFAHALLLIHEEWVQYKPTLHAISDPNGSNSYIADYVNTSLSNLLVVPKLYGYGFKEAVDWNESELGNWNKFDPSQLDTFTIRMRCLMGWVNTINLADDENTISTARKIIKKLGCYHKARQLNHKLMKYSKNREKQINCVVKYLKIPPNTARLIYFNPINETRIEKEIGVCDT